MYEVELSSLSGHLQGYPSVHLLSLIDRVNVSGDGDGDDVVFTPRFDAGIPRSLLVCLQVETIPYVILSVRMRI